MNTREKELMLSSGIPHRHNFQNRYLSEEQLVKPLPEQAEAVRKITEGKLLARAIDKTASNFGTSVNGMGQQKTSYMKFISKGKQGLSQKHRLVKMQEAQVDPFNPSRFQHKKVPRAPSDQLPPQILRSTQKKLTQKDYEDWKVPPCTSNWKNNKGFVIPLQMRLAANGRSLQNHTINERFADMVDTLFVAEQQCRKELQELAKVQKSVSYKEHLLKEEKMKATAQAIRAQKLELERKMVEAHGSNQEDEDQQVEQRQELRYIRRRELERQARQQNLHSRKKYEIKQAERKISEKIDLKRPNPTPLEDIVDERVIGHTAGMDQGFGQSDEQNVFDQPLFDGTKNALHKVRVIESDDQLAQHTKGTAKAIRFQKAAQ